MSKRESDEVQEDLRNQAGRDFAFPRPLGRVPTFRNDSLFGDPEDIEFVNRGPPRLPKLPTFPPGREPDLYYSDTIGRSRPPLTRWFDPRPRVVPSRPESFREPGRQSRGQRYWDASTYPANDYSYRTRSTPRARREQGQYEYAESRHGVADEDGNGKAGDDGDDSDSLDDESEETWDQQSKSNEQWEDYDDFLTAKAYEFHPLHTVGDGELSDSELPLPEDAHPANDDPAARASKARCIFQSHYIGDAFLQGTHSVALKEIHDPNRQHQPLFRWLHLQQAVMSFEELSDEVSKLPMPEADRRGIGKLLADVKRNCISTKSPTKGVTVRYMEPGFLHTQLPPEDGRRDRGFSDVPRSAMWLCIPFFSLHKYSGLMSDSKTGGSGGFPVQTLLQVQYARNTERRDKLQVVCQSGNTPSDHCFHIAQLWCIVLDNSVLITCGSMSEQELRGTNISLETEPLRSDAGSGNLGRILVVFGDSIIWSLPAEECRTWFAFVTHFRDFWPQTVQFIFHDRILTPDKWPDILRRARGAHSNVTLSLRVSPPPQAPPRGILKPLIQEQKLELNDRHEDNLAASRGKQAWRAKGTESLHPAFRNDKFHVFTWADEVYSDSTSSARLQSLQERLEAAEKFLLNETSFSDRRVYEECRESTRQAVYTYLEEKATKVEAFKNRPQMKKNYEARIDIFNAVDIIFRFFFPGMCEGPTVKKFWGAVLQTMEVQRNQRHARGININMRLVNSRELSEPRTNLQRLRSALRQMTLPVQAFKNIVGGGSEADRAAIKVPEKLMQAWLHFLMFLVYSSHDEHTTFEHYEVAESLMRAGMRSVIESLSQQALLERSVVLPLEVVSLASLRLLQDMTGKYPNISETYSEFLKALETDITTKASDRTHSHRINLVRQELSIIKDIISQQSNVFTSIISWRRSTGQSESARPDGKVKDFIKAYQPGDRQQAILYSTASRNRSRPQVQAVDKVYWTEEDAALLEDPTADLNQAFKLAPTDPGGFRDLLAGECANLIERRARDFTDYELHADTLEQMNMNKIDITKDRQEQAIYAFTLVTIIFLPLSAVSGIFGMNTSDFRNMDQGQWLYWATAIPVTILVIVLGLWWMKEPKAFFDWLRGPSSGASFANVPRYPEGTSREGYPPPYRRAAAPVDRMPNISSVQARRRAPYSRRYADGEYE